MMNATNNTSTELSSHFVGQPINDTARAIFSTLGTIMILCGVTGSGLLITVLFRRFRQKQNVHDLFLANLTLADLLNLGYWLTFFVLDLILGFHPVVNLSHCVVNAMICYTLNIVCISSLVFISFNRYLHVCHSQLCKRFFTLSRTVCVIVCIWILAMLLSLPPVLGIGGVSYGYNRFIHICAFRGDTFSYAKAGVFTYTFVPMIFIGFCNFAIFRFWKRTRLNLEKWKYQGRQEPVITRQAECVRQSREMELKETPKCDSEKDNPIPNSPTFCVHASSELDESGLKDSQNEAFACDAVESEGNTERPQITHFSYYIRKINTESCNELASCSGVESCSPQQRDEQDLDLDKVNRKHDQTKLRLENVLVSSTGNLSSGSRPESTEKAPVKVAHLQPQVVLNDSLSVSPDLLSRNIQNLQSTLDQQKEKTAMITRNVQLKRNKQNAREVAFVRSLFVVFLITFITLISFAITAIISITIAITAEIRMFGLLMLYTNNTVNWIVYGVMNPSFRKAYRKSGQQLLGLCCQGRQEQVNNHQTCSQSSVTPVNGQRLKTESEFQQSSSQAGSNVYVNKAVSAVS